MSTGGARSRLIAVSPASDVATRGGTLSIGRTLLAITTGRPSPAVSQRLGAGRRPRRQLGHGRLDLGLVRLLDAGAGRRLGRRQRLDVEDVDAVDVAAARVVGERGEVGGEDGEQAAALLGRGNERHDEVVSRAGEGDVEQAQPFGGELLPSRARPSPSKSDVRKWPVLPVPTRKATRWAPGSLNGPSGRRASVLRLASSTIGNSRPLAAWIVISRTMSSLSSETLASASPISWSCCWSSQRVKARSPPPPETVNARAWSATFEDVRGDLRTATAISTAATGERELDEPGSLDRAAHELGQRQAAPLPV